MKSDKERFLTLKKERYGLVSFGNENSVRILGKGTFKIIIKDSTTKTILLVEDMKHNLLSISQMCDQEHMLVFYSKKCEIRKEESRKLVTTTIRTPRNIYVLNDIGNEICFLGKDDESWLWHKRMGHINFDNLVKVRKKEAVREMHEISSQKIFYASIIYRENIPIKISSQRNNSQQNHLLYWFCHLGEKNNNTCMPR
jgi:hypothetical protein